MSFRHKFVWTGAGILLVALAQTGSIVWAQSPVLSASAVAAPNAGAAVDADDPTRSACWSAARRCSTSARRSPACR